MSIFYVFENGGVSGKNIRRLAEAEALTGRRGRDFSDEVRIFVPEGSALCPLARSRGLNVTEGKFVGRGDLSEVADFFCAMQKVKPTAVHVDEAGAAALAADMAGIKTVFESAPNP